jgi:hypothetical protein
MEEEEAARDEPDGIFDSALDISPLRFSGELFRRRRPWLRWCGACLGASRRRDSPTSSATSEKKVTCKLRAVPSSRPSCLLPPFPSSRPISIQISPISRPTANLPIFYLVRSFIQRTLVFVYCGSDGLISSLRFNMFGFVSSCAGSPWD